MTTTEVTSVYDQCTVSATVSPVCGLEFDGGALTITRAIAIYRRASGGPWEFGPVRLRA